MGCLFFLLFLSGCGWPDYYGHMRGWGMMNGYGIGGVFMWLLFLILIGVIIYFVVMVSKKKDETFTTRETPLEILKKRYAKGEIDKEIYEQMKKDLEG
jgi:putative membrane protein